MNKSFDQLIEKWSPVLNEESAGKITDYQRKAVTAQVLENQERALMEERSASQGFLTETATNATGSGVNNWDPVLISLVRRSMPNLMAYDVCGVQPMSGPTGLIFAMKSKYTSQSGTEALFNEADSAFSGSASSTQSGDSSGLSGFDAAAQTGRSVDAAGRPMGTSVAESLGNTGPAFAEMGFSIEKQSVVAKSRALKAEYSLELAQDLKAIHGLDAETELANILSTEILAEINREVIRTINTQAVLGAQQASVAQNGVFDLTTDADGRWSAEKFKGLVIQLDREANQIAKTTRRGKGNIVICSSDVATALAASGQLDFQVGAGLQIDDTGNTFAGTLNGKMKVYIDPYATTDYVTVGYKGTNAYDAGVFYCPYVPLQMVKAVGENDFQPRIGFKTRYGMASNPFVSPAGEQNIAATAGINTYYRIFRVDNIMA
jgi:hypothetical protein|tara:strand:- start:548 stop:1849 length:1302 start_codon:yes stop_codon:yes gene_type:complete